MPTELALALEELAEPSVPLLPSVLPPLLLEPLPELEDEEPSEVG
jgi:hypothetical protein